MIHAGGIGEVGACAVGRIAEGSTLTVGVRAPADGEDPRPLDVRAIDAWLGEAQAGDELHYCSHFIPRTAEGPRRLRALHAIELVTLFGRRMADRSWHYFARRTAAPIDRIDGPAPGTNADGGGAAIDDECERLFNAIALAANAGRPCPTNGLLSRIADISSADRVSYLLGLMERRGVIIRVSCAAEPRRRVTIVATGNSTGTFEERTRA